MMYANPLFMGPQSTFKFIKLSYLNLGTILKLRRFIHTNCLSD